LYQICLLTGDAGQDATSRHHDPKLLGHCVAAPYGLFEPSLAFAAEDASGVAGYIVVLREEGLIYSVPGRGTFVKDA